MADAATRAETWWGLRQVEEGRCGIFRIGSLRLWASHLPGEWRIAREYESDAPFADGVVRCPEPDIEPPPGADVQRFASRRVDSRLTIVPVLADRPVVARPEVPLHVLSGGEARLFISTAVWVRIGVGVPISVLLEAPTVRSPDTWFGPSTREGEVCYASRTAAQANLAMVDRRSSHAITSVFVRNRADENLHLERIALPVPALSLFSDVDGNLWTEEIAVERDREGDVAQVKIGRRPPEEVEGPERVAEPRRPEAQNVFVRALGSLLR